MCPMLSPRSVGGEQRQGKWLQKKWQSLLSPWYNDRNMRFYLSDLFPFVAIQIRPR